MSGGKYGKYLLEEPKGTFFISEANTEPFLHIMNSDGFKNLPCGIAMVPIMRPWYMERTPMKHDFDQILCFIGADLTNIFDFQAEVEFCLGEEQEKHTIKKATAVFIPKGLSHGPLNYKVVRKPVLHLDVALTSDYARHLKIGKDQWKLTGNDEMKKLYQAAEKLEEEPEA